MIQIGLLKEVLYKYIVAFNSQWKAVNTSTIIIDIPEEDLYFFGYYFLFPIICLTSQNKYGLCNMM